MPVERAYEFLRVGREADGQVVVVELHRPESLNAMNTGMGVDFLDCFNALMTDRQTRAVVLTAAGERAFCVGGDLKQREGMSDEEWRAQHEIFEQGAFRLLRCPVPVICAVEGYAFGGSFELAVLSDFIVASETAVFAVPEVTRGIFPGIGGTQHLPRILRGLHLDGAAAACVPHSAALLRRRHPHRLGEGLSGRVSIALY